MADLHELAQTASQVLARSGLDGLEAEVVLILDVSRSMFPIYRARIVQELIPQLLGLALNFDDDGVIPAYAFGDEPRFLRDLRRDDFHGWVDREVIRTGADYQQGCRYAPVIHEVCRYYFPEDWDRPALKETVGRLFKQERVIYPMLSAPRAYPVFALFVTGGECQDEEATADAIRRASRLPIFFQFIGLSAPGRLSPFRFLKRLDKLGNTYVDNCGFFEPGDTRNTSALYRGLVNELPDYIKRPEVVQMLRAPEDGGLNTRGFRPELDDPDAHLDALTALPTETQREPEPEPEPEPERDLSALRAKFEGIEWVEGTHGGGAMRSAAPVQVAREVEATPGERRRLRPSELAEAARAESPADRGDSRQRVLERLNRLKAKLTDIQDDAEATAAIAVDDDPPSDAPDDDLEHTQGSIVRARVLPTSHARPAPPARPNPPSAQSTRPTPPSAQSTRPTPPDRPTPPSAPSSRPTPPPRPSSPSLTPPPPRPTPPSAQASRPTPPPRPAPPAPPPPEPRSAPSPRPQPPPRAPSPPSSPSASIEALRARLAALGDDESTVAASGYEVDREPAAPPGPPSRPQPPPRRR